MAIQKDRDFIFVSKGTVMIEGVTFSFIIGTRRFLFVFPYENITGAGNVASTTKYTIGGKKPQEFFAELITDPDLTVEKFEEIVREKMASVQLSEDKYLFELAKLEEFNIKMGFLSKGIYLKRSGQSRVGIGVSGKDDVLKAKEFYGK